jgi:hypothetical protein
MIIAVSMFFLSLVCQGAAWADEGSAKVDLHGTYRIRGVTYNYASFEGPETDAKAKTLFDQRFRFSIETETESGIKGVLGFEVGDIIWGLGAHDVGDNWGGAQGADVVNVEVRNAYLDFGIPSSPVQLRAGIQSPLDGFKGYLFDWDWDFDVAGVELQADLNSANLVAAWFRLNEGGNFAEYDDRDLLKFGADIPVLENGTISPYFYYLKDKLPEDSTSNDCRDYWLGASFSKSRDGCDLSGFFLYNSGKSDYLMGSPLLTGGESLLITEEITNSGFAANLEANKSFKSLDLDVSFLYSTGEDDPSKSDRGDFHVILGPNYANYLEIFFPGAEDVAGVNVDLNNDGLGLFALQGRIKAEPRDKVWLSFSGGFLQSAAKNTNGEKYMGTELDGVAGYKFTGGMTAELGAAYVFVGDFYKDETDNPNPDNMYEVYCRLQFSF